MRSRFRIGLGALALALPMGSCAQVRTADPEPPIEPAILVQYLEYVCADVDATCSCLEQVHGVTFGEPIAELGNARTATLAGGGRIAVRAPMAPGDMEIVRPYALVADIDVAVKAVQEAGGTFAMLPTEVPGQGKFAIYFQEGLQFGLWENP